MKFLTKITTAAVVGFAGLVMAGSAQAVTTEFLIDFEELTNNSQDGQVYTAPGGLFQITAPAGQKVNFSSTSGCIDDHCLIETGNGPTLTLSHSDTGIQGPYDDPFDFLGFYFRLVGNHNFVTVSGYVANSIDPTSLKFETGKKSPLADILYYSATETAVGSDEKIGHSNTAYFVDLSELDGWKNLTKVVFSFDSSKQTNIDCIRVSYEGNGGNQTTSCGYGDDDGGTNFDVPLPASLPLLLAGVAGFGVIRRKKHKIS